MGAVTIIAVGKNKQKSGFYSLWSDYQKRLSWKINLIEIEAKSPAEELKKLKEKLSPSLPLIALDETGKTHSSIEFSKIVEKIHLSGEPHIQFVIGGADGLDDEIRSKARHIMSFGKQTWPHMLARVMLIEQIYRAQQILSGHPYHRE
ncbi:MAG: 23S rRNA (pseudouridine(1915)-N(3))-methyltransferase RlmH [Pseudomonadota bacterium]